jgi:GNAT superfamily N-acetyltransferase
MGAPVTITVLDKTLLPQAAGLLSRAFNEAAEVFKGELEQSLGDSPWKPVVFAALQAGQLVGVIECDTGPEFKQRNIFALSKLAIAPEAQGQGIGHELVKKAEEFVGREWMEGRPGTVAVIDGTKAVNPSSRFYENMDYKADTPAVLRDGQPVLKKRLNDKPRGNNIASF